MSLRGNDKRAHAQWAAVVFLSIAVSPSLAAASRNWLDRVEPRLGLVPVERAELLPPAPAFEPAASSDLPADVPADKGTGKTTLSATASVSAWSGTRRLDHAGVIAYPQVLIKLTHKPADGVALLAEGYVGQEQQVGGPYRHTVAALREAYVSVKRGPVVLRAGSQIIAWGRADGLNPTDNLSAQDYSLLADSDAAQKLGVPSVNLLVRRGDTSVQAIWQPAFRASRIPLPASGIRYVEQTPQGQRDSGGIRIDTLGERLSWSLSYFQGPSKRPSLALSSRLLLQGRVPLRHPQASIYGADAEWVSGHWALRGEAAYEHYAESGSDPLASRESFVHGVISLERDFGGVSAFLLASYRKTFDYQNPRALPGPLGELALAHATINGEVFETEAGWGGGFLWTTSDLRWRASADFIHLPAIGDFVARPRLRYRLNDELALWGGGDYFSGVASGPYGRLADNSTLFVGLGYDFITAAE